MSHQEFVTKWWNEQAVHKLSKYFFNFIPTKRQRDIIHQIVFTDEDTLVTAYSQYGKTQCVAIGICLYILFKKKKEFFVISPQEAKSKNVRNMIMELIMHCSQLRKLYMLDAKGDDRLMKEASRKRMTFKNGCVLQFFSAEGDGQRLMGFGLGKGGKLLVDELAEIPRDVVYTKILRMMAAKSEETQFIGLFNPWSKDTAAYDMWNSGKYVRIHIGYPIGIDEGRIKEAFVEERRLQLTKTHFQVLYESIFPDETDDTLIPYADLNKAREIYDKKANHEYLLGCDIAAYGVDLTVLTVVKHYLEEDIYAIECIEQYKKQDTMTSSGKIINLINKYKPTRVNIDGTGLGQGVYDRLKEQGFKVSDIKVGRASLTNSKLYLNQKSEMYDNLRRLFEKGQIKNLSNNKLFTELSIMTVETTSNGKMKIIDPEKSPDFADSLALCLFSGKRKPVLLFASTQDY